MLRVQVAGPSALYKCIAGRACCLACCLPAACFGVYIGSFCVPFLYGLRDACLPAAPGHSGNRFSDYPQWLGNPAHELAKSFRRRTDGHLLRVHSPDFPPQLVGWNRSSVSPSSC